MHMIRPEYKQLSIKCISTLSPLRPEPIMNEHELESLLIRSLDWDTDNLSKVSST